MDTQLYLEFDTDLQLAAAEEWIGREYGRVDCAEWSQGQYPIPPYSSPNDPPLASEYTWKYAQTKLKAPAGSGGVLFLDDEILRFATQPQTLSNGQTFGPLDFASNARTFAQLSDAGKEALAPPPPPNIAQQ